MQMKKVIAGCIDLMLEFDSASELDRYIADIEVKKQEYFLRRRMRLWDAENRGIFLPVFQMSRTCDIWGRI